MSTAMQFVTPTIILIITIILAQIVKKTMQRIISRSTADLSTDPTNYKFLRHLVVALIYILGLGLAIYSIPALKAVASSILAGAGIVAVAVGFASQAGLSNIISGIFIILFKPFRINDRLTLQAYTGIVEDITLRHTVIRDFENRRIIVPNANISNEILINSDFGEERICKWVDVGISYDSDIDRARQLLQSAVIDHPLSLDVRKPEDIESGVPQVMVRVVALNDSDVRLRAWAWAKDAADAFVISCDVIEQIKKQFDEEENVSIPYPHSVVYLRKDDHKID
jgi:small-conductance mechanosensitive channel